MKWRVFIQQKQFSDKQTHCEKNVLIFHLD